MHRANRHITAFLCSLILLLGGLAWPIETQAASALSQEISYQQENNKYQISIPLPPEVDYKVEAHDYDLLISFNQPLAKHFKKIRNKFNDLVISADISSNGRSVLIKTKGRIAVNNAEKNHRLVIDIEKLLNNSLKSSQNIDSNIRLNYGDHEDFSRFVFEFNGKPSYSIKSAENKTTVSFVNEVNIIPTNLDDYPLSAMIERQTNQLGGTDYIIPQNLLKSSELNNKLVLDLKKSANKMVARASKFAPPALAIALSKSKTETQLSNAQISNRRKDEVASLSFSWNVPVGLSVFKRGKYIWVIFDHNKKIEMDEIRKLSANVADEVLQIPHNKGVVLRFTPKKGINVGLRQEGLLWIVDLYTHDVPYKIKELPIFTQYNSLKQAYLFLPTPNAGTVISVVDPEIGDAIIAVPNNEIGVGTPNAYQYPDLDILSAQQGSAIIPNTSDIIVTRGNTGVSIKGYDRGLNISDDLEEMKRQQMLGQTDSLANFDLKISPQILKLDFNTAQAQLEQDIEKAEPDKKIPATMELAKYYVSQGLGTNALKLLNPIKNSTAKEAKSEKIRALLGVANFLAKRYDEAIDNFSYGKLPNNNEAIFWRTLSASAQKYNKENNIVLLSFISVIKDYPQELKERIALVAAANAIKANDDISTQNFMDILKSTTGTDYRKAEILYLNAQKFELQGYPRNAAREYANIVNMFPQKYSSLSRFEKANLGLKLGVLDRNKAIAEYEKLRYAWGELGFKRKLLDRLAGTYAQNNDYYNALRTYKEALVIENPKGKEAILNKMVKLFEEVYIDNRADDMSPLKSLALYQDFDWLAPRSSRYNEIIQHLADRLVAVDLLERAATLLKDQLRQSSLSPLQRTSTGARLALVYLFQKDNIEAINVLDKTRVEEAPQAIEQYRKIIRATALANLGRNEEALALLENDDSKNALLVQTEIYWNSGQWAKAADKIKYLIEKPVKDQPLSEEQIGYILDWATALKKSGQETVIVRLRNRFEPYFAKTPYASVFNVLTNNLEKNKIDIKAINQAVDDIAAYSNFSKIYNQSLQNDSFSKPAK